MNQVHKMFSKTNQRFAKGFFSETISKQKDQPAKEEKLHARRDCLSADKIAQTICAIGDFFYFLDHDGEHKNNTGKLKTIFRQGGNAGNQTRSSSRSDSAETRLLSLQRLASPEGYTR